MVLYLDSPCPSVCPGISVSKHTIFTLCCFAAELNALSPYTGHWLQTIQFSTVPFSLIIPWLVGSSSVMENGSLHLCLWYWCRGRYVGCAWTLVVFSFALLPSWISTVNVCPLHSILVFDSVCLGQFNY